MGELLTRPEIIGRRPRWTRGLIARFLPPVGNRIVLGKLVNTYDVDRVQETPEFAEAARKYRTGRTFAHQLLAGGAYSDCSSRAGIR